MFKRILPMGGLVGIFAVVAFGLSAAAAFESSFERTEAYASFQSSDTYTFINVSRGTSVIETDDRESLLAGTIVSVGIFRPGAPGVLGELRIRLL